MFIFSKFKIGYYLTLTTSKMLVVHVIERIVGECPGRAVILTTDEDSTTRHELEELSELYLAYRWHRALFS